MLDGKHLNEASLNGEFHYLSVFLWFHFLHVFAYFCK